MNKKEKKIKIGVVGGTFSLLHTGHKHLLRKAAEVVDRLIIGVTSDRFVEKMNKDHPVEPFSIRIKRLIEFLREEKILEKCRIVEIDDFMGPAGRMKKLDVIIVTDETLSGALEINAYRVKLGLNPLVIITVSAVLDETGVPLSSTKLWTRDFLLENEKTGVIPSHEPKQEQQKPNNRSLQAAL